MPIILSKLLGETNSTYVDWSNPSGAVLGGLIYDWDGEILPMDEARSLRERFTIGNVLRDSYSDVWNRERSFEVPNRSLREGNPVCNNCAYNPLCGTNPVLDFSESESATPIPGRSADCLWTLSVLDWTIEKLIDDPSGILRMAGGWNATAEVLTTLEKEFTLPDSGENRGS